MATSLPKTCKINPLIIVKRLQTDLYFSTTFFYSAGSTANPSYYAK